MKRTCKNLFVMMLVFSILFMPAASGFAAEGEITVNAASKVIAAKDSGSTLKIPFTAEMDGSTAGFVKTASDSSGNVFPVNKVWFDDSYMYLTNGVNASGTENAEITVTCEKNGKTAEKTITVYPYIEHDFTKYEPGTLLSGITPETASYAWSKGSLTSGANVKIASSLNGVNYLNPYASQVARLCFGDEINIDSETGDVTVEINLFKHDENETKDFIGFRAGTYANTVNLFSYVKNERGGFDLYDTSANTNLLKENVQVGETVNVKIAINYTTHRYSIYVNEESTPAVSDVNISTNYANCINFTAPITGFAVYSGEKLTPLDYVINEEFSDWEEGTKYSRDYTAKVPEGVNNVIVNTGDENSAYFEKITKDGKDVLEAFFAPAETASTQNVRYPGKDIGSRFMIEYSIFIENNGIRAGVSGEPNTTAGSADYWPEMFYFENDGYFRSDLLTGDSYLGSYRLNEWNNVQLTADTETGKYSIYLNGYPMVVEACNEHLQNYTFKTIRHNIIMRSQNGNAHKSYLDYLKTANIGEGLNIDFYRTDFTFDGMLVLNQNVLIGENVIDAAAVVNAINASGKSASVISNSGAEVTSGNLEEGYKIYVTSANGRNTCCYAVSRNTHSLYLGKTQNTTEDGAVTYDVTIKIDSLSEDSFSGSVIVAEYDESNKLIKSERENQVSDGKITVTYVPQSSSNSIKAFAWKTVDSMVPLTKGIAVK